MANKHEGSNALAGAQEEGPEYVDVEAFGHQLSLLRGLAENLITLEKEGAIYTHFWHEPSQTFRYYRIKFLPREIFEYVEAHVAKKTIR